MQVREIDPSPLLSVEPAPSGTSSFHSCVSSQDGFDGPLRRRTYRPGTRGAKWFFWFLIVAALILLSVYLYKYPMWHMIYEAFGVRRGAILQFGTIPIVAAIVGWGTNAVAISMTFYPLEFVGCCRSVQMFDMPIFGWQGIIPANVQRMAEGAVENLMTQMFNASEAATRLDTKRIALELRPALEGLTVKIVETIAEEYATRTWKRLPIAVKREILQKCVDKSTGAIARMSCNGHSDVAGVFDLQKLLVELLVKDKPLVNDIFLKMFDKEYEFIRVSGAYLGFAFGLIQMWIFTKFQQWWSLVIAGFLVGYLTNFVALKCLFHPIEPLYLCGSIKIHGLFLQRQARVANVYGDMFSKRVLNAENLLLGMINSPSADELFDMLDENVRQGIDVVAKSLVLSRRLASRLIGRGKYAAIKARVVELVREDISSFVPFVTPYLDEVLDVQATLEREMSKLSSQEFADMMLPAFREGEFKLIVIGGFLGAAVGCIQALWQAPDQLGLFK